LQARLCRTDPIALMKKTLAASVVPNTIAGEEHLRVGSASIHLPAVGEPAQSRAFFINDMERSHTHNEI
jgi:hypothetical protein